MKGSVLIITFMFCSMNLFSQPFTIPLWDERQIPNHQPSDDIERADTTEIIRISLVQSPDITVYLPSRRNATGEAVVICPGGGYWILAYDWEGLDIAKPGATPRE